MPAFKKVSGVQVTKCTPEVIKEICNYLLIGAYVETAVVMAGVGKKTFYDWIKNSHDPEKKGYKKIYAELRVALDKAVEEATLRDLAVIDRAANGSATEYERYQEDTYDERGNDISGRIVEIGGHPVVKKKGVAADWSASAWRLERRKPKEWSRTEKVEHSANSGAPQIVLSMPSNGREVVKKENG